MASNVEWLVSIAERAKKEEQRSYDWFLARQGKITASECYLLLQKGRGKDVEFSQTCMTYLEKKISTYYYEDNTYLEYCDKTQCKNKAVEWGTDFEGDARERFTEETGIEVILSPFIPLKNFEKFAGGSPDGIVEGGDGIIEIKCPFTPETHMRHYMCKNVDDFAKTFEQYYAQMQMNMLCVSADRGEPCDHCYFISYDPRTSYDKQISVLYIPNNQDFQLTLLGKIKKAVEMYKNTMNNYDNIKAIQLSNDRV